MESSPLWKYIQHKQQKRLDSLFTTEKTKNLDYLWARYVLQQAGGNSKDNKNDKIWCGAGVYLIDFKKVGKKTIPCLIVFRERNRSRWTGHSVYEEPGGKLEPHMKTIAHGAQAELREESRNLFNFSPKFLSRPLSNGDDRFVDVWTGHKGFRVYAICLKGVKKRDYQQNVKILDNRDKVPWSWLETNDLRWIPLSEFKKTRMTRVMRESWGGKKDHRGIVQDINGVKLEIGARLVSGMKKYGGLKLCEQVIKYGDCLAVNKMKKKPQEGFLKGTISYSM